MDQSAAPRHPSSVHDAVLCVSAPALAMSGADGQLRGASNHGFYAQDRRLLSRLVLRIDGLEPEPILGQEVGGTLARFAGILRDKESPDPELTVERTRDAKASREHIRIANYRREAATLTVEVSAGTDLAEVSAVSGGRAAAETPAAETAGGLRWESQVDGLAVELQADPPAEDVDAGTGTLRWHVRLDRGESWDLELLVRARPAPGATLTVQAPSGPGHWDPLVVRCGDPDLARLTGRSLDDLRGLLLSDPEQPEDLFLAAGAPWYLTLFGRDSLWAARLLLPLGTELAGGTLRTLARRQGVKHDAVTDEAPGKIIHELRPADRTFDGGSPFPAKYYGTIDATPLFVTLLAEARRWGMPDAEAAGLLPAAERALGWLRHDADPDGDGFLKYIRTTPGGLANQGWKDSGDSVQFADGTLAEGPIALCEVQGYAYEAALNGAYLLDAFARPGGAELRDWAADLRERFRARFWVEDAEGAYPAIALDARKRPVDGLTSNIGHLLGTGLLDPGECSLVAARLGSAELDSGWGLRTRGTNSRGFNPLSYHNGTVWAHDTAIAAAGLAKTGHHEQATALLSGLVAAAPWFGYRMPELYAGEQRTPGHAPSPYPASCRPQAWSAAAAVSMLQSALGLAPDVPEGKLVLSPSRLAPFDNLEVSGLRVAGEPLSVSVRDGRVTVETLAAGLEADVR
ncbi:glycogen debranching N-terminal domain-containing protein [Amycolatopsis sp. H20-H5]|uniref:glycogen debranching N-terminal domain-containing protein n=1 Tax=Amycolatopsis sp. H20-H5 TaxID=3046309 RepID=UPI002DBE7250|nr:glycogen debranching N-terminal domain-containing protein [Amycolatopsis sp. H20-H5]MEC3979197.1 glycogen debranching N-terminal domain-containing protein [Amycolatopsis sp. H20-H5]